MRIRRAYREYDEINDKIREFEDKIERIERDYR